MTRKMVGFSQKPTIFIPELFEIRRGATLRRASKGAASAERPCGAPRRARPPRSDPAARPGGAPRRVLESVKKLEALFIAPPARQILHETAQRAYARCACAQHTGILIQYLNQGSGSERRAAPVRVSRGRSAGAYRAAFLTGSIFRAGYSGRRGCREFRRSRRRICRAARPARCARRPRSPRRARSRRSRPDRRR